MQVGDIRGGIIFGGGELLPVNLRLPPGTFVDIDFEVDAFGPDGAVDQRAGAVVGTAGMESCNATLLHSKNPVELSTKLFVFIGVYTQCENLGAFQPRISRPDAASARTTAFILEQFLPFG